MGEYGEPLSITSRGTEEDPFNVILNSDMQYVAEVSLPISAPAKVTERIVACVNALDGVPDEAIPMVKKLVELARTKSDKLAEAYKQLMQVMVDNAIREVPNVDT